MWQLGYELTETYTCEFADCSSPNDNAVADAAVSAITNSITTSLGSDQFLTVLSQNVAANPGTLDTTIFLCLAGKHTTQMTSFMITAWTPWPLMHATRRSTSCSWTASPKCCKISRESLKSRVPLAFTDPSPPVGISKMVEMPNWSNVSLISLAKLV